MWGSATLAIVVSSPCMMFANMIDSVTQPRLATGPRDAIPGLDESAIRISPWSKNRHIMIGLTTPKAKARREHGCRAFRRLHSAPARVVMRSRSVAGRGASCYRGARREDRGLDENEKRGVCGGRDRDSFAGSRCCLVA